MGFALMSTPEATIPNTTKKSKWIATDAPAIFEVQRWDARILNLVGRTLTLDSAAPLITLQVGEPVLLVQCSNLVPPYNWVDPILTSVEEILAGANRYKIKASPITAMHTHIVAPLQRVGYYFKATLNFIDNRNGDKSIYITAFPSPTGRALIQVNQYLADHVSDVKATTQDGEEVKQSGRFSLLCREIYDGAPLTDSDLGDWFFAKAARTQSEGVNLAEYVPNSGAPCRFFNQFEEPTLIAGEEFEVNFLPPDEDAVNPQIVEKHYDDSGAMLSQIVTALDSYSGDYVLNYKIDTEALESNCAHVEVILQGDYTPTQTQWVIAAPLFSEAHPLTLNKALDSHTVNFTGRHFSGIQDQLPTNVLYPQAQESVSLRLALGKSPLAAYTDIYDWHFTPSSSPISPARVGYIGLVMFSARGFSATYGETISQEDVNGGNTALMAKFRQLMQGAAGEINTQSGTTAVLVTQNGTEVVINSSGGYPVCFGIFTTAGSFWSISVNRLANPDWIIPTLPPLNTPVLTLYPDGKMVAPRYEDLGVTITSSRDFSGSYTTTL